MVATTPITSRPSVMAIISSTMLKPRSRCMSVMRFMFWLTGRDEGRDDQYPPMRIGAAVFTVVLAAAPTAVGGVWIRQLRAAAPGDRHVISCGAIHDARRSGRGDAGRGGMR